MSEQIGHGRTIGDLAQEILDRLIIDPEFKQMLLDRPAETLAETGYPVTGEVSGYMQVETVEITTAISCPPNCNIGRLVLPGPHNGPDMGIGTPGPRKVEPPDMSGGSQVK